jgi:transcription elongation factor GreB
MSKAFTRDEGAPETVRRVATPSEGGRKRPVTRETQRDWQAEREGLLAQRPALLAAARAAELADLDARLAFLGTLLEATEVPPEPSEPGAVYFGAWVLLEDEDGGEVRYRLVGPDEVDVRAGHISLASPVGRALLGRRVGDEVVVERPRGPASYTVREILAARG